MRYLILIVLFLSGCTVIPTCPEGREYTDWCECDAPIQGNDC